MRPGARSTMAVAATGALLVLTLARAEDPDVASEPASPSEEAAAAAESGEVGGLLGIFFPKPRDAETPAGADAEEPALAESEGDAEAAATPSATEPVAAPGGGEPSDGRAPEDEAARDVDPEAPSAKGEGAGETEIPAVEASGRGEEPALPEPTPAGAVAAPPVPSATPDVPVLGTEPEASEPALAVPAEPATAPSIPSAVDTEPAPPGVAEEEPAPVREREEIVVRPAPVPTPDLDADLRASRRPPPEPATGSDDIQLPTEEIYGEIEKPDIFFLLPKARSKSDEQLIRSRIQREITRPLIKDWLEEELLLK